MKLDARIKRLLLFFTISIFILQVSSAYANVKFCAVGDVLFDRGVRNTIKKKGVNSLFEKVRPIVSTHDLAFCNLECPLTSKNIGYPLLKRYSFRGDPESVQGLSYAGFNVVSVANNHTIDWGRDGFLETIRILKENNIYSVGGGRNQEESLKPVLIKKKGLTFAFFGAISFLLEAIPYLEDKPAPGYAGIEELTAQIVNINNKVDFVIVSFHWGIENYTLPTSRQVEYAHRVIDAGADLVLGHHPHVLQSIELYKDRFIIYSLGNFVFDNSRTHQKQTVIFSCEFDKGRIICPQIIPIIINNYQPQLALGDDFEEILKRVKKISKEFKTRVSFSSDSIYLTGENNNKITIVPIKEWKLQGKKIQVYTSQLKLINLQSNLSKVFPIKDKSFIIKDACLVKDDQIVHIYAIMGDLLNNKGKQLAIFPIELEQMYFKIPLLDIHTDFNPWKILAGDVDDDGNPEILMGVWKATRYHPVMDNRLFVFNRYNDTIYPKWFGSLLVHPFIDFQYIDIDKDGKKELITLETDRTGKKRVMSYKWNEFGFNEYKIIETNSVIDDFLPF